MKSNDFKLVLKTKRNPEEVFQAICRVRKWWTGYHREKFTGQTTKLNDEFSFSAEGGIHYSKQKLVKVIPNKRIVWLVTESTLGFVENADEWAGTKIIFDITKTGSSTQLIFTHQGLTRELECYDSCAPSWTTYLRNSLLPLINQSASNA